MDTFHKHQFKFSFQCTLLRCAFVLNNFIRSRQLELDIFEADWNFNDVVPHAEANAEQPHAEQLPVNVQAATWRDSLAQQMWDVVLLADRGVNAGDDFAENEFDDEIDF